MRIKLLKPTMDRGIGSILDVNDDHAKLLVEKGNAVEAPLEIHTKAVASASTKQADALRPHGKGVTSGNINADC